MSSDETTAIETPEPTTKERQQLGADLRPDFTGKGPSIVTRRWYWVGALPSSPVRTLVIGGVSFSVMREEVMPREGSSPSTRIPKPGELQHLSEAQVEAIRQHLPRTIIRFMEAPKASFPQGAGVEVLNKHKPRNGHAMRIMSDDEIKLRRKNGYPAEGYTPREWDEAAADHVFILPCNDQNNPRDGGYYPDPVSETGLAWE